MTRRRLLDYLTRVTLVGMALFCGAARGGESDRTQAAPSVSLWQVAEIELTSSRTYANPYGEIDVTVTFTGLGGESVTRLAFWDGGSAWKVPFAPTALGTWNWRTECSDRTNEGLHGRSGRLDCVPKQMAETSGVGRANQPPHIRHGFLRVSDNRRHFVHADGTPFFWLGDTHWQMPDTERLDACNHPQHAGQTCPHGGQFQHLVADRRGKGFNGYHEYFYGPSRSPGTLRSLDPSVSYRADWFDPRIGAWTPIDMNLRADNGQWKILTRPDGDWILVVRKQNRTAATQMVVAPSDDYPRNGEATWIVSTRGELLLFYGAHAGSGDWDRAVIRAVRSADGGRTWSEPVTQLEDSQRSLFQPSLTRLANGELGLTHTVLAHGQDAHKVFRRSGDEGRTWSEPLKISDDSHAYTTGPHDRLYTLSSGRLLALLHCNLAPKKDRQGGPLGAYVVYSDDHGQTWTRTPGDRVLHVADNPYHKHEWGFWEPSLVEHEPGKLLMMARTATGWLYECRSEDGGSTWTTPTRSAVPNPLAPPALTQIPGTGTIVLLHNPRVEMESGWHVGPRTVLALRTSRDGGRTWSDPHLIAESGDENDWYDYPAVRWTDETLHVAYRAIATRNRGQGGFRTVGIEYRTLTSAWLKEAK